MKQKYGVLLTGGRGTRLQPFTNYLSKHLLNVDGKPIIDYPLNSLKMMGVTDLIVVVGSNFSGQIIDYIKDGSQFKMNVLYKFQSDPLGISHAINICQNELKDKDNFVVMLGDNIYQYPISSKINDNNSAKIILNDHPEKNRFGIATIGKNRKITKIEEKPINIDQNSYAITGCYFLTNEFFDFFKKTCLEKRGEYEITSILKLYNKNNKLTYSLNNGWWNDVGTIESINETNFLLQTASTKKCKSCNEEKELKMFFTYYGIPMPYCKICDSKRRKQQYYDNHEKELENKAIYYSNNKEKVILSNNASVSKRRKNDPGFALRLNISSSIRSALFKHGSDKKEESCLNYLPYSLEEFEDHLESLFEPWMNWDNYGAYIKDMWDDKDQSTWKWQLDHIIPQSDLPYTSMEDENFKRCWALDNLRPYSAKQNQHDGASKIRHNK